jgi:hypothetical protein
MWLSLACSPGAGEAAVFRVDQPVALALELRTGKIVRAHAHTDAEQALATIGSPE